MNDFNLNNTYDDKFYKQQIKFNKNLLKFGKPYERKKAKENLLELKGRLLFERRMAENQISRLTNID
jgi:hypothetical protein